MKQTIISLFLLSFIIFLNACSAGDGAEKRIDYDTTKKMVVDILQTEDGKKAIQEMMADEKMKQQLVIDSDIVKEAINNVLISEKGIEMWTKMFKDATFVEIFAKSMSEEQKKLFKKLIYDPDFQEKAIELLQNPEIDKQMLTVMKSQQFRKHLEETITQTLETPLFQARIKELLLKAAENQDSSEDKGNQDKQPPEQGNDSGGAGDSSDANNSD